MPTRKLEYFDTEGKRRRGLVDTVDGTHFGKPRPSSTLRETCASGGGNLVAPGLLATDMSIISDMVWGDEGWLPGMSTIPARKEESRTKVVYAPGSELNPGCTNTNPQAPSPWSLAWRFPVGMTCALFNRVPW